MQKQKFSYSPWLLLIPVYLALFFTVSVNAEPELTDQDTITIDMQDVTFEEILHHIADVSGTRVVLLGDSPPEGKFSLQLENTTIDKTIKKLLQGFDYITVNTEQEKIIYIVGQVSIGVTSPNLVHVMAGEENISRHSEAVNKSNSVEYIEELLPTRHLSSGYVKNNPGHVQSGSDGIDEFIPERSQPNDFTDNRQYKYLQHAVLEVVPVTSNQVVSNKNLTITNIGTNGISEVIPVHQQSSQNREMDILTGQDGLVEIIYH